MPAGRSSSAASAGDDDGILAAPAADRIRADRGQFGRRPVGQAPAAPAVADRPAVAASAVTVHLRRKNRNRRNSHGTVTATESAGATTASASTHRQPARRGVQVVPGARDVESRLAGSGRAACSTASPTSGMCWAPWPADARLPATPFEPLSTCRPASAMVAMASCTAMPTNTQIAVHSETVISLISWPNSRTGLVE